MAEKLLSGEEVSLDTPEERCYYADAEIMRRGLLACVPGLDTMDRCQIAGLMAEVKGRLDHLTITGSLNQELTDVKY
jgi:nitrogenase delta subunit